MRNFCLVSIALAALQLFAAAAEPRPRRPGPERLGPWNRDLVLLRAEDGKQFSGSETFVERGGVPCLARDTKGRLIAVFQWFPYEHREHFDRIAIKFSDDDGRTWSPTKAVEFIDLPGEYDRQFDPTVVPLEDGRYRLYFTSRPGGESARTAIFSAISEDALRYTFEPGARFKDEDENVVDCSLAHYKGQWHLFAPIPRENGKGYHAVSKDGLRFERLEDVSVPVRGSWIGNVMSIEKGLRFFGSGEGGVWSATSSDGAQWKLDREGITPGGDPGIAALKSGGIIMAVTGGLREDAPSDPPWRQFREPAGPEPFAPPTPSGQISANAEFVYVLQGDTIYQYNARNLTLVGQAKVPRPQPRRNATR